MKILTLPRHPTISSVLATTLHTFFVNVYTESLITKHLNEFLWEDLRIAENMNARSKLP